MKGIIFALLLVQQNGPVWNPEQQEVPFPTPSSVCIEFHWADKEKAGEFMRIFEPPLDQKIRNLIDEARKRGMGNAKRCAPSET